MIRNLQKSVHATYSVLTRTCVCVCVYLQLVSCAGLWGPAHPPQPQHPPHTPSTHPLLPLPPRPAAAVNQRTPCPPLLQPRSPAGSVATASSRPGRQRAQHPSPPGNDGGCWGEGGRVVDDKEKGERKRGKWMRGLNLYGCVHTYTYYCMCINVCSICIFVCVCMCVCVLFFFTVCFFYLYFCSCCLSSLPFLIYTSNSSY